MNQLQMAKKKEKVNKLKENLKKIKNIYIVMSGKGGVGKSTISSLISAGLSLKGNKVGILDCDFHGPSIPFLFGVKEGIKLDVSNNNKLTPVSINENLKLISIGFLLENGDQPIIWRGPMKMSALNQFLEEVEWNDLDYLIIDLPPGTGDEVLNIIQLIKNINGAVVVTIPQDVALFSVRKSLSFLNKANISIVGLVSNMDGFICPHCDKKINIFSSKNIQKTLTDYNIELLAQIPMDPILSDTEEHGELLKLMEENKLYIKEMDKLFNVMEKKFNNK